MDRSAFRVELQMLIAKRGASVEFDAPDFVLADYLMDCLSAFRIAAARQDIWRDYPEQIPVIEPIEKQCVEVGMSRTRFEASFDKHRAVDKAEAAGEVSDSMAVRMVLIERMNKGELTLAQVGGELKRIKREGKRQGKLTRAQVFSRA